MSGSFYPGPYPDAFTHAEEYLAKGKNKSDRPVGSNTRLRRIDADTIALVLHSTAVVTYHRDATMTIYGGGWDTVTTKKRIGDFSPVRVRSVKGEWIVGYTGEVTPAKLRKCRSCKGRGTWMEPNYCTGPRAYGASSCDGGRTVYDVPHIPGSNWEEHWASRRTEPCEHGRQERHATAPCPHGEWKRHPIGEYPRSCYRCAATGTADYGSDKVPILGSAHRPWKVNAAGDFLGFVDGPPAGNSATWKSGGWSYQPPTSPPDYYGSEVVTRIAARVPGLDAIVKHPAGDIANTVSAVIISLNDRHGWSRERIADWLDTLDVDLRFPATDDAERGAA